MKKSLIAGLALYAVIGTSVFAFAKTRTSCPFQLAPAGVKTEAKATATIETISPQQAQTMMQAGAKMVDVREPAEWETVRVNGSTLIPLAQVKAEPKKAALAPRVLLMCHSGRRAKVAADAMKNLPNVKLFVIEGGITGWQDAGLPVQKK
jgi:rhodanese-related sulfurtransferase